MPFYALATIPLNSACKSDLSSEVWFADDATGCGNLTSLQSWWDKLNTYDPQFGYHPNGCKTWLITKQALEQTATNVFANTNVHVTTEARKHLGAPLGSESYINSKVSEEVKEWTEELDTLSEIVRIHPHVAYCAYIHGLKSKWLYLTRTTPDICDLLEPIETTLRQRFIPSLTSKPSPGDQMREVLSLPARLGGLAITNPKATAKEEHQASLQLTASLVSSIDEHSNPFTSNLARLQAKSHLRQTRRAKEKQRANTITEQLPEVLKHAVLLASEKGASSWPTALPLHQHGFSLHKST